MSQDKVNQILDQKITKSNKLDKLSFNGKVGWDSRLDGTILSLVPEEGSLLAQSLAHERKHVIKTLM